MNDLQTKIINQLIENWEFILFCIFTASIFLQMIYYLLFYLRIAAHKNKKPNQTKQSVSIVICARDEEENLKNHLPTISNQNHSNYEVFVILDACSDDSQNVVKDLLLTHKNLRYTTIVKDAKFSHGKKLALTIGIKGAQHNILLLTDADCVPSSPEWINYMTSHLVNGYDIVLGYGKYKQQKGFLNQIVRYDTFFIAQQYLSFALSGFPYMGVGRNLVYTKEVYTRQGGFSRHAHLESGDDDLLINAAATRKNCTIEINKEAHTLSNAPKTFKKWRLQKQRHFKTAKLYKTSHKILLTLEPLSRLLTWFTPIPLYFMPEWQYLALALSLSRFTVFMTITKLNMNKLNEQGFWLLAPLFDIVMPIISTWFVIKGIFNKKSISWK